MDDEYEFGHFCCKKEYPPPEKIKARCFEPLKDEDELKTAMGCYHRGKITFDKLKKQIENAKAELKNDIDRYENIRKHGDKVMSKVDLMRGYTAQTSGLPLKYAHIGYSKGRLQILEHWQKKLYPHDLKTQKGKQKELF